MRSEEAVDESTTRRQKLTNKKQRPPFSWTQPCCAECWVGLKLKTGRLVRSDSRHCCYCRAFIGAGDIYLLRVNPGSVPYPTIRKEDDGE